MKNQELHLRTVADMAVWNLELDDELNQLAVAQANKVLSQYPDLEDTDSWVGIMGTLPDKLEEHLKHHLHTPDLHRLLEGSTVEFIKECQKELPDVDWTALPEDVASEVWTRLANKTLDQIMN